MRIRKTIRFYSVTNCILSMVLALLLIFNATNYRLVRNYNKNLEINLSKLLSPKAIQLIILVVSGDRKYFNSELKKIFKENQILHLLVLSGGNLVILILFLEAFQYRNSLTYFVLKYIAVAEYFVFTNLQHPLARAIIFILISDFHLVWGFKLDPIRKYSILIFISIIVSLFLDFSFSFTLSLYFAFAVLVYGDYIRTRLGNYKVLNFCLYSLYMTLVTSPLMLIFSDTDLYRTFISNLILLPVFEFIIPLCYFIYFYGGFFDTEASPYILLEISSQVFSALFAYLDYLILTL